MTHLLIPFRKLRKLAPSISFPSEFTSCGRPVVVHPPWGTRLVAGKLMHNA